MKVHERVNPFGLKRFWMVIELMAACWPTTTQCKWRSKAVFNSATQFGDYVGQNHQAGYMTVGIGRNFNVAAMKSSVWLYCDWASGDDDLSDNTNGTFQPLTPRGRYYLGYTDLVGRQNIRDVSVQGQLQLTQNARIKIALHNFWLANRTDALDSPGGAAIYQDPSGQSSKQLAQELDLLCIWNITPRTNLVMGYSYVWSGDFFDSPVIQGGPAGIAVNGVNGNDTE
jgi:hypothetical protein